MLPPTPLPRLWEGSAGAQDGVLGVPGLPEGKKGVRVCLCCHRGCKAGGSPVLTPRFSLISSPDLHSVLPPRVYPIKTS